MRVSERCLPEGDAQAVTYLGVEFAYEQCKGLLRSGVPGIHLYTMDRANSVEKIVTRLRQEGLLG